MALAVMLFLYSAYALAFFFLDGFRRKLGIENTGFFLTAATAGESGVKILGGGFFDRLNKISLLILTMIGLCMSHALLGRLEEGTNLCFPLGLFLGFGWGIAMPVVNGLMYDISKPSLKAFNTNLGFQMLQGGFFLGPIAGSPVVALWGYGLLFDVSAILSLLSACLLMPLKGRIINCG